VDHPVYKDPVPTSQRTQNISTICHSVNTVQGNEVKVKAFPVQAWTGLEGSRRLRFPDFNTIDS